MPDEDKTFRGSLVLDYEIWWRLVKTIYSKLSTQSLSIEYLITESIKCKVDIYLW